MKILVTLGITMATYLCSAQQQYYDVTVGNGNGVRFWQSDSYKIHMGAGAEYQYGPVTDYSIKMNMDVYNNNGRGWTWGTSGVAPIAALNTLGNMQIAGTFQSGGNIINNNLSNGWIGLTGDLPGYTSGTYGTLKTNATYLYFSGGGKYSGYIGGSSDAVFGLNDASANTRVSLNSNGNSYFNGGNVGIGTSAPLNGLHVYSLNNSNNGSIRFGFSGSNDGLLSLGFNALTGRDALKLSYAPHNYTTGLVDLLTFDVNGNAGIGTANPSAKLNIYNAGQGTTMLIGNPSTATGGFTSLIAGTSADSNGYGFIESVKSSGAAYGDVIISRWGGNVGIGTTSTDAKLSVKGQIHAQEVKVDLNGSVAPDYVFNKDYQLTSLDSIKNYIDQNKHLPEVPSAAAMEKNGVQLGEMNMLLLKKIEELTLYVIEQNRKIDGQNEKIDLQGRELIMLKSKMK